MGNAARLATLLPHWRLRPLVAALIAAGPLFPGALRAATLTVATLSESSGAACTLRDAIDSINAQADHGQCVASGAYGVTDSVGFAPSITGTITFFNTDPLSNPIDPSALVVRRPIIIQGPGSTLLTLACGNVTARLLEIDASASAVSVSGVTISGCHTAGQGGGVLVKPGKAGQTVGLTDVTLTGNAASLGGGLGITGNVAPAVTLTACSVTGNNANIGGGGLSVNGSSVNVLDSLVAGNSSPRQGGGAFATGNHGGVTFTRTTISGNRANQGGGIYVQQAAVGTVLDSTVAGNRAIDGAGVYVDLASFAATNSTFSGNDASGRAGAVIINRGGPAGLLLANSTIAANLSGPAGAVAVENTIPLGLITPAVAVITNTIIAGNQPAPDIEANDPMVPGGVPWDVSYSVIGDPGTVMLVGTGNQTGGAVPPPFGMDGWLGPLQNNGGPTQTHALLHRAPALDAGDPAFSGLLYDQRGAPFFRVVNGRVDIGAYEAQITFQPVPGLRGLALFALSALLGWLGWRRQRKPAP